MSIHFNWLTTKSMLSVLSLLMLSMIPYGSVPMAARFSFSNEKTTIVVDPGHGGYDNGAQGPSGTLEKTVALQFAQMLQAGFEDRYRVAITRTTDYAVDTFERANFANHAKADLFISIHTGGGFRHQSSGCTIFYFSPFSGPDTDKLAPQPPNKAETRPPPLPPWHEVQVSHTRSSRRLAKTLQEHVSAPPTSLNCTVYGAPLLLLEGLDMPAILIEIGYLTNPTEEKNLKDTAFLTQMAEAIHQGVDMYFQIVDR